VSVDHTYCTCDELGPIVRGCLYCIECGREFYACPYCPQIFYSEDNAIVHDSECDQRTILDDIIKAVDA